MADVKEDAVEAFNAGTQYFKEGKYIKAAAAFREANALRPNWKIFYNIAQSEAAAKRYGLALESFEAYLAHGGDEISTTGGKGGEKGSGTSGEKGSGTSSCSFIPCK